MCLHLSHHHSLLIFSYSDCVASLYMVAISANFSLFQFISAHQYLNIMWFHTHQHNSCHPEWAHILHYTNTWKNQFHWNTVHSCTPDQRNCTHQHLIKKLKIKNWTQELRVESQHTTYSMLSTHSSFNAWYFCGKGAFCSNKKSARGK